MRLVQLSIPFGRVKALKRHLRIKSYFMFVNGVRFSVKDVEIPLRIPVNV